LYSAPPDPRRTLDKDKSDEGNRAPIDIVVKGLDEAAIKKWWEKYKNDPKNKWETTNANCSSITVLALQAGGAKIGPPPSLLYWSPDQLKDALEKLNKQKQQ
jgi:hypothetical protein